MVTSLLDDCLSALADPKRRAVLERLQSGDATVTELARPFAMSLPGMRKHLALLEKSGLVSSRKVGRTRHVRLAPGPLRDLRAFLDHYEAVWLARFDQNAGYIDLENLDVT